MKISELVWVIRGSKFDVTLTRSVSKKFERALADGRARIMRNMKFYGDEGPDKLHSEVYRHEGRFSLGHKSGKKLGYMRLRGGKREFTAVLSKLTASQHL